MKAVSFALFAFAASSLAGPVISDHQLDSQADELDKLFTQIQGYTGAISKLHHPPSIHEKHPVLTPRYPHRQDHCYSAKQP